MPNNCLKTNELRIILIGRSNTMVTKILLCFSYVLSFPILCKDTLFVLNGQKIHIKL